MNRASSLLPVGSIAFADNKKIGQTGAHVMYVVRIVKRVIVEI